MRKLLLSLGFLLGLAGSASAQCIAAGSVNNVPQPGIVCQSESIAPTYAAVGIGIVPASSATDIACLQGAAGIVVRVQSIRVSGTAGTSVIVPVVIKTHATIDTGGTPASSTALPVPKPVDSTNAAAKATANAWTANPTITDSTPIIVDAADLMLVKTDGTNGASAPFTNFNFADPFRQPVVLRGAAQEVCVNLNATSPSSGLVNVAFSWTELAQ